MKNTSVYDHVTKQKSEINDRKHLHEWVSIKAICSSSLFVAVRLQKVWCRSGNPCWSCRWPHSPLCGFTFTGSLLRTPALTSESDRCPRRLLVAVSHPWLFFPDELRVIGCEQFITCLDEVVRFDWLVVGCVKALVLCPCLLPVEWWGLPRCDLMLTFWARRGLSLNQTMPVPAPGLFFDTSIHLQKQWVSGRAKCHH